MTNEELFAWRDQWMAEHPWFEEALAAVAEYERAMRALKPPVIIVTLRWRDGKFVEERREVQS